VSAEREQDGDRMSVSGGWAKGGSTAHAKGEIGEIFGLLFIWPTCVRARTPRIHEKSIRIDERRTEWKKQQNNNNNSNVDVKAM